MSMILAALLAQLGPSVSPGAGGALPQAPLEIPRKAKVKPTPAPVAALGPLQACQQLAEHDPLAAIDVADDWLQRVKGSPLADPAQCKAFALIKLERWGEAEALFVSARDAVPLSEPVRRARLGASAGVAADSAGVSARALALLDTAHADALRGGNAALAGDIALSRAAPLVTLGRKGEAAAALAEARVALPDNSAVWLISARFSRQQDQLAEAQVQIETAARLAPRDPEIGLEAGIIAAYAKQYAAARKSWASVIAAAPGSDAAKAARRYLDQLGPETAPPPG